MVKIWRNRVWAGTQRLSSCPVRYKNDVMTLMRQDIINNIHSIDELKNLVENGLISEYDYKTITEEEYEI